MATALTPSSAFQVSAICFLLTVGGCFPYSEPTGGNLIGMVCGAYCFFPLGCLFLVRGFLLRYRKNVLGGSRSPSKDEEFEDEQNDDDSP